MQDKKRSTVGRPKSNEKRQQILSAASCLFLKNGLAATSMDNIAVEAGVSKQTVYSHFTNKDALFRAVINWKVQEYQLDEEHIMQQAQDISDVLTNIGSQFVQLLHDPEVISMHRTVMGEVSTNPHIAELFYEEGPKQAMQMLKRYLLSVPQLDLDESKAAKMSMVFFNMLKGDHHMKSLMGLPFALTSKQQKKFVSDMVSLFVSMLDQFECA